jgi:outer membrane receptor protein involved in Fe transport
LPQKNISKANYEESTPDYLLVNGSIRYTLKKWATIDVGVNNIFNQSYYSHLNRRVVSSNPLEKIKLYEPGRVFFVNLKLDF